MTIRERIKHFIMGGEKGIEGYQNLIVDSISTFGGGTHRAKNPILENIYETIANDVALGNFKHVKEDADSADSQKNTDLQLVLGRRMNELQSPAEFLNAFTYQLVKYGNAIAIPYYNSDVERKSISIDGIDYSYVDTRKGQTLEKIELIDVSDLMFGFGYDDKDEKYLLFKDYNDDTTNAIRYSSIIHVRHQPKNVFYGDKMNAQNFNMIPDLIDKNISTMLTMLSQGGNINGILKIKNGMQSQKDTSRANRVSEFAKGVSKGIILADANEEFQVLNKSFDTVSKETIDTSLEYLYSIYGINSKILTGNYTEQEFSAYYNHTVEPIIKKIEQEFNYKLIGINRYKQGHRIVFRKKLIAGATLKDITAFADKGMYQGWLNGNIISSMLGLDNYDGGEIRYTNLNAVNIEDMEGGDNNDTEGDTSKV